MTLQPKWNEVVLYINFELTEELANPKTLEMMSKTGTGPSDMHI
jgi:hypothetical protein